MVWSWEGRSWPEYCPSARIMTYSSMITITFGGKRWKKEKKSEKGESWVGKGKKKKKERLQLWLKREKMKKRKRKKERRRSGFFGNQGPQMKKWNCFQWQQPHGQPMWLAPHVLGTHQCHVLMSWLCDAWVAGEGRSASSREKGWQGSKAFFRVGWGNIGSWGPRRQVRQDHLQVHGEFSQDCEVSSKGRVIVFIIQLQVEVAEKDCDRKEMWRLR